MNNENFRTLCLDLINANDEDTVIELLKKQGYWDDQNFWRYYGDNRNNFSTIGNQQSSPEAALIEKLTNAIDAVLLKECRVRGIDPDGEDAPQSIVEAQELFFNIPDGKLSNIPTKRRTELAQSIYLAITGTKNISCCEIIDFGEGQTPEKFPETFVSLNKENKLRIQFVQGKFNMGGTGVLQFSGRHNLQLIVSKRNPQIEKKDKDPTKDKWGFTIVRRKDPVHGIKNSVYEYLVYDGNVPYFASDQLEALPLKYPESGVLKREPIRDGTFIKLYDYQVKNKWNVFLNLFRDLQLLMPSPALPIRACERRPGQKASAYEYTMSGLQTLLDENRRDVLEEGFPYSEILAVNGQKLRVTMFAFKIERTKEGEIKHKSGYYHVPKNSILFTVNGQTHAALSDSFFGRKSVGLGILSNDIIVIVDCSDIEGRAREDLFMNSRDKMRDCPLKDAIEKELEETIRDHPGFRELKEKRHREFIESRTKEEKPFVDIMKQMVRISPSLSSIFKQGVRLPNPLRTEGAQLGLSFKGRRFPTYFTLIEKDKRPKESPKEVAENKKGRVQFLTDVVNDYFSRDDDAGDFTLYVDGEEVKNYRINPYNGYATLTFSLPEGSEAGDELFFESYVNDVIRSEPFYNCFYVKVGNPIDREREGRKKGNRRSGHNNEEGKGEKEPKSDIPPMYPVKRTEWGLHDFDEYSATRVEYDADKGWEIYWNEDNKYLLSEMKIDTKTAEIAKAIFKYELGILAVSLIPRDHPKKKGERQSAEEENGYMKEHIRDIIRNISKDYAPFIIPKIRILTKLMAAGE